jgi:CDP-glucose 4,6-dehydratase
MLHITNKKIIVTGGTGFIGSHLVESLVNQNAQVLVLDITLDPSSYFSRQKLNEKVKVEFVDIAENNKVNQIIANFKPDFIFHLAAEAIVEASYDTPYRTFQTNVMGTVSMLEACRMDKNIKGIIVASSDKAYGKTDKKYTEDSPLQGDHPYDVSKSCTDLITQAYYKTYKTPAIVTRFGNVYGEGDFHKNRIIPGICEAVVTKNPLLIRSDGTYVRDYVYVKDVVNGYIFLLQNIDLLAGQAFNFSSEDNYSVLDLIKKAEEILQTKIDYKILNIAKNEIPYQHLDDTKIRKAGWKSEYTLEKALPKTIDWYKQLWRK